MPKGYEKSRFSTPQFSHFLCCDCKEVAIEPRQCHSCGKMFCEVCLINLLQQMGGMGGKKCPSGCSQVILPIVKSVKKIYNALLIKCANPKCLKEMELYELPAHELKCMMIPCWNYRICGKAQNAVLKKNICSQACGLVRVLHESFGNRPIMYQSICEFNRRGQPPQPKPIINTMVWMQNKVGTGIEVCDGGSKVFLKESFYLFRTAIASIGFTSGVNYWEIIADARTQNQIKTGVTNEVNFDLNSAFCDHQFGFAYYGLAQTRHASNATGPSYGKKFKKEGVLGCCLNMQKGTLSFALNNDYMGVAFTNLNLTRGPIYPAVALLHCAGCSIAYGKPLPPCFKADM